MKIFKTVILGMVFLFGLTAMSNVEAVKKTPVVEFVGAIFASEDEQCDSISFDICDAEHPHSYEDFDDCMQKAGCNQQ